MHISTNLRISNRCVFIRLIQIALIEPAWYTQSRHHDSEITSLSPSPSPSLSPSPSPNPITISKPHLHLHLHLHFHLQTPSPPPSPSLSPSLSPSYQRTCCITVFLPGSHTKPTELQCAHCATKMITARYAFNGYTTSWTRSGRLQNQVNVTTA